MATQDILILTGIVTVFLIFGIALAGADYYSRGGRESDIGKGAAADEPRNIDHRRAA